MQIGRIIPSQPAAPKGAGLQIAVGGAVALPLVFYLAALLVTGPMTAEATFLALGLGSATGMALALGAVRKISALQHLPLLSDAQEVERRLEEADTDPLTGVLNRRGFDRRVPEYPDGAILMLDLDHFKAVNDDFGHDAGDAVLLRVADVLREELRKDDVLARYGGEEFVIFLPETALRDACRVAERARAAIAAQVSICGRRVTASFGVSAGSRLPRATLIAQADRGAYAAKAGGRNRICPGGDGPMPDGRLQPIR